MVLPLRYIGAIGLSSLSLRVVGLLAGTATVAVLMRRKDGSKLTELFIISVLPLYFAIYFNQLRLAIGHVVLRHISNRSQT